MVEFPDDSYGAKHRPGDFLRTNPDEQLLLFQPDWKIESSGNYHIDICSSVLLLCHFSGYQDSK